MLWQLCDDASDFVLIENNGVVTARKRSLRRLCFYSCLSGGMWQEACVAGGVQGWGVCMAGGCAWQGGVHGWGGMHGRGHAWLGGHAWQGACICRGTCVAGGGMCGLGRHAWQGGVGAMHGRGCVTGGHVWQGGVHATADTMGYGQWTGSTHPTGMHSCSRMGLHPTFKWFYCFQWEQNHKHYHRVVTALMLMLGINGALNWTCESNYLVGSRLIIRMLNRCSIKEQPKIFILASKLKRWYYPRSRTGCYWPRTTGPQMRNSQHFQKGDLLALHSVF